MNKQTVKEEQPKKQFIVAPGRIVWHSKEDKHYFAGETVDLSHLADANIAAVLASGAIVEIKAEQPEVTNG